MPQKKPTASVRLDLSRDEMTALLKALDLYDAYLTSQQRGDRPFKQITDRIRDTA